MQRTRALLLAAVASVTVAVAGFTAPAGASVPAGSALVDLSGSTPGLSRLLADGTPTGRAIVTLDAIPGEGTVAALERLGLTVQPLRRLPMALVDGPVAAMELAVTTGIARDVYPDEAIELLDTASSDAMGTAQLRARGLTGKGVTVAVVDSGCDATHPDLADHVEHNVSLVSAEYANIPPDSSNTLVVPLDQGPYSNTDIGGGHGTHVAGIVAADSTSAPDGSRFGVAPDATLDCFAIGQVLFTTAVVTAYDYMLDQPDLWGIDVVNNSWGNSYRQFDPRDPVAVATRAVAEQGVTVVFAAGNSGAAEAEMSVNPFAQSPWVISVAAGTVDHRRGDFSSNGLVFDNSEPTGIGAGGHTTYLGDRIGVVHPDITAPGVDISSSCDTLGTVIGPCPPGDNATASGTSMASPHIAGAAAVLLQANPGLTPEQVRLALQATATPVYAADGTTTLPFWQVGYGYADLAAAVDLVGSRNWAKSLARAAARADSGVLAADGTRVERADFWTYDAPRAAVAGTDQHTYTVPVGSSVERLKVTLSHPSLAAVGANATSYVVTITDPRGRVVGTTTETIDEGSGTATATVDLAAVGAGPGTWTFDVSGEYAASDPDTVDSDSVLGRMVTLHVAQLRAG
ncbi:MAG TPA: S8 family serine peptidase [Marmoricola sp.]|nr:S8 family serine peptidase [Marmoricola sp.]